MIFVLVERQPFEILHTHTHAVMIIQFNYSAKCNVCAVCVYAKVSAFFTE